MTTGKSMTWEREESSSGRIPRWAASRRGRVFQFSPVSLRAQRGNLVAVQLFATWNPAAPNEIATSLRSSQMTTERPWP